MELPSFFVFEDCYERLCREVYALLERNDASISRGVAIGVSCGGPPDSRRGVALCPPNLSGWANVPLTDRLRETFGVLSFLRNDANVRAPAEWKLGAGRSVQDMIFLPMGAGVISEGRPLRGPAAMGGEGGICDLRRTVLRALKGFLLKRPISEPQRNAVRQSTKMLLHGAAKLLQGLSAIALAGHAALSTVVQNDLNPLLAPAQQAAALSRSEDVLIAISTSGHSRNVALTVRVANGTGLHTRGLTGGTGGWLKQLCHCSLLRPATRRRMFRRFSFLFIMLCALC